MKNLDHSPPVYLAIIREEGLNKNQVSQTVRSVLNAASPGKVKVLLLSQIERGELEKAIQQTNWQGIAMVSAGTLIPCDSFEKLISLAQLIPRAAILSPFCSGKNTIARTMRFRAGNASKVRPYQFSELNGILGVMKVSEEDEIFDQLSYPEVSGAFSFVTNSGRNELGAHLIASVAYGKTSFLQLERRLSEKGLHHAICPMIWAKNAQVNYPEEFIFAWSLRSVKYTNLPAQTPLEKLAIGIGKYLATTVIDSEPAILYVLHNDIENARGGTELHTVDLINHFSPRQRVYTLFRRGDQIFLKFYFKEYRYQYLFDLNSGEASRNSFTSREIETLFAAILKKYRITIIHFQHLMGLPLTLLQIGRSRAKTFVSLNDYYLYCSRYDLIKPDGTFCNFEKRERLCELCLQSADGAIQKYNSYGTEKDFTGKRRAFLKNELKAHHLIAPSRFAAQKFSQLYGIDRDRIAVVEHPLKLKQAKPRIWTGEKLNLGFVGSFEHKKGASIFVDIVKEVEAKSPGRVNWVVLGSLVDLAATAELLAYDNVKFAGAYSREQIPELCKLYRLHIGLILSIWPETYAFTLSESLLCGLPVIATDLGAQGDRVRNHECGWVVPADSAPKNIAKLLETLLQSPRAFAIKSRNIPRFSPFRQQCKVYENIYRENQFHRGIAHFSKSTELHDSIRVTRSK